MNVNWIKVEDSLPEEEEEVLVYSKEFEDDNLRIGPISIGWLYKSKFHHIRPVFDKVINITHWQPMPSKPEVL
ncbi:hypothetical protein D3C71_343930 [compost metagenome]